MWGKKKKKSTGRQINKKIESKNLFVLCVVWNTELQVEKQCLVQASPVASFFWKDAKPHPTVPKFNRFATKAQSVQTETQLHVVMT